MAGELPLAEQEGLVADVAVAHELEEGAEQAPPRRHLERGVVALPPDQGRRVDVVPALEPRFADALLQDADLLGYAACLVVEDQGDDVVGGVGLERAEVARLVYEDRKLSHAPPGKRNGGVKSPP